MPIIEYDDGMFDFNAVNDPFETVCTLTDPGIYVFTLRYSDLTGSEEFHFLLRTRTVGDFTEMKWPDPPMVVGVPSGDGDGAEAFTTPPVVVSTDQEVELWGRQVNGSTVRTLFWMVQRIHEAS